MYIIEMEIAECETDFNDKPLKPVVIKRIYKA